MPRAIWKGQVTFGLVSVPVFLHPGEISDELDFTLLDQRDFAPIGYEKVNKDTGEPVPGDEIVRGYEVDDGQFVVVTDEDLEAASPKGTQTIEIETFVDLAAIDPRYFDKPYYLAPATKGLKPYALLAKVLESAGKVGVARVVIRTRQYLCVLLARDGALVLERLRFAHEIRSAAKAGVPVGDLAAVTIGKKELDLARRLVEEMAGDWKPEAFRDDYRDEVLEVIEEKAAQAKSGERAVRRKRAAKGAAKGKVVDLMTVLKQSVEQAEKGRKRGAGSARKTGSRSA